jgi:ATP-dependent exoDNAse (exonuclease V) beta subunit
VDKQVRHSATSLEKYQNCSLLWYHHYIDGWREPQDEGAAFGIVLHEAVAYTIKTDETNQNWSKLYAEAGVPEPSHELIMLTEDYYDTWLQHQCLMDYHRIVAIEKMYEAEVEGYGLLSGKIDALWHDGEGYYIVDHKFMRSPEKKKSNQQMAVYSLLEPRATRFFYEKVGLGEYEMQEIHHLEAALQKIHKTIYCINEEQFSANPQRWFQPYCPFLEKCGGCK